MTRCALVVADITIETISSGARPPVISALEIGPACFIPIYTTIVPESLANAGQFTTQHIVRLNAANGEATTVTVNQGG